MAIKIEELAEKLDSSVNEILTLVKELEFDYDQESLTLEDDVAELIEDEIGTTKSNVDALVDVVEGQLEREVVKSQRKKTAGKDTKIVKTKAETGAVQQKIERLEVDDTITVKELAEKTGVNAAKIIGELMKNGVIANINQLLDFETASLIMSEFGVELKKATSTGTTEDFIEQNLLAVIGEEDSNDLVTRPPIITVMGHVDHGKTKLLDAIRHSDVVAGESGGITQHIGAYQITLDSGKKITCLDTPGHEAFTQMRSRGAKITDIAILVVAATEGVKPTTIEAINHAKDAGVPIVVAINKIDLPEANLEKVKSELAEHGLQPEEWGGDTVMVPVSALQHQGIDKLLEMVLLIAEMQNLKANPNRLAVATVIETHLDLGKGPVATVLVNTGTLRVGDVVVVGDAFGKIKSMENDLGEKLETVPPATPAQISGLSKTPQTGDILQVMKDDKTARLYAEKITDHRTGISRSSNKTMNELILKIRSGEMKVLKVIVKSDTKGSFEAIKQSLEALVHDEVMVNIIHSGIGNIKESDVAMAAASHAVILGFHVDIPVTVEDSIERTGVVVQNYKIIYEMVDDVRNILSGLLSPELVTVELGLAEVRQVFFRKRNESILGLKLTNGVLRKGAKLRVKRGEEQVGEGVVLSLQKVDKQVDEIKAENECGIKFKGDVVLEEGDKLEAYVIEERIKSL